MRPRQRGFTLIEV
ncbi:MAG: prepilin-type N-terminal cleavage/methylation domain-containing protein, partial [Candidatus Accumulibacter sp.]|nr:prepilin-type N-terminal cleavage/methylation domain-containing protein [Accumulibacter sp.]